MKSHGLGEMMVSTQSLAVCSYTNGVSFLNISTGNTESICMISVFSLVPYEWHS